MAMQRARVVVRVPRSVYQELRLHDLHAFERIGEAHASECVNT